LPIGNKGKGAANLIKGPSFQNIPKSCHISRKNQFVWSYYLDHGFLHVASIQWATAFTEFYFCEFSSFGEMFFKRQILSNIPIFSRSFQKLKRNSKKISMFLHIVQASSEDIKGFLINF
jgi:hypothetical protein